MSDDKKPLEIIEVEHVDGFYDEVEIEDMEFDEDAQTFYYPCPCGDRFQITMEEIEEGEDRKRRRSEEKKIRGGEVCRGKIGEGENRRSRRRYKRRLDGITRRATEIREGPYALPAMPPILEITSIGLTLI